MKLFGKLILLLFFLLTALSVRAEDDGAQVLVLHSYHRGLQWTDDIMKGVESAFSGKALLAELHVEYMDTKRHAPEAVFPELHDLYLKKYRGRQPDLIVVSDDNAYNFVLNYGEEIFPGVPVVFCGLNYFEEGRIKGKGITGVVEGFDVPSTLDAVLALFPETEKVFVVNDLTVTGLANKMVIEEIIPGYSGRLVFTFLEDLAMEELQRRLQLLPDRSVVLLMSFNRDRAGRTFSYQESIRFIAPFSRAPIFGVWEFYLGQGIVGGRLTRGFDQGEAAGLMGLRILGGEAPEAIPVLREGVNTFMFDYERMRRFGIDLEELPEGSLVENRPSSFYGDHKEAVLAVATVVGVLSILVLFLLLNILKRRRAEESLMKALEDAKEARDEIDAIIKSIADGLIVTDMKKRVLVMNRTAENLLGISWGESFGKSVDALVEEELLPEAVGGAMIRDKQGPVDWELPEAGRKRPRTIQIRSSQARGTEGGQIGVISIFRDVTRERETDRMKSEFISTAAHELNTPLTSVLGYGELLLSREEWGVGDPERQKECLTILCEQAERFSKIVDDLLHLSRVQSGRPVSLERRLCDLRPVVEEVVSEFRTRGGRRFVVDLPEEPVELAIDRGKFVGVMEKILNNAVNFSPEEEDVRIGLEVEGKECRITVTDRGIGMSEEETERIFDPFFRADASDTAIGGIGLGMAMVRNIIEGHGGEVRVESEVGEGTRVRFSLPMDRRLSPTDEVEGRR